MKKILLIDPIYNSGNIPPNIPLSKIAAGLLACGIETDGMDFVCPDCEGKPLSFFYTVEQQFIENIKKSIQNYTAVYITSSTGCELKPYPVFPRIKKIALAIKETSGIPVYVGGALMNLYVKVYGIAERDICQGCIDQIILGNEYIGAMEHLIGGVFPQSIVPFWNLWQRKLYPEYKSVQYHVGCPYSCDFCFEGKIFDKRNDSDDLTAFLSSVNEQERIIVEDSVVLSYPDFYKIADDFMDKKVEYSIYARISEIVADPKKISMLSKSGCKAVIVGIETLDNNVLKEHNKNIVTTQTRKGLDILNYYGINIQGCFMLGFPEDTLDNMKKTIDFAINEKLNGYRWHIYQPNYTALSNNFYSKKYDVSIRDHFMVQLNVPDNCLGEIMSTQPAIGKLDEHFMFRGKKYISSTSFNEFGYENGFSYREIKDIVDCGFPTEWILNEEKLYNTLFEPNNKGK